MQILFLLILSAFVILDENTNKNKIPDVFLLAIKIWMEYLLKY